MRTLSLEPSARSRFAIFCEVLLHALVDARAHLIRQVDALHAHVDQLDAEDCRRCCSACPNISPVTAARSAVTICSSVRSRHHALDAVLDDLGEPLARDVLAAAGRPGSSRDGVRHAPLHVEIDDQAAVVVGEERLAGVGLREDAADRTSRPGPTAT